MKLKTRKQLIELVESYVNGNISSFKEDIRKLNNLELLDLLEIFIDYGYSLGKLKMLLN